MLDFIHGKTSDRKLRLFAVACGKSVWNLLSDKRKRKVVKLSELLADGLATEEELRQAIEAAGRTTSKSPLLSKRLAVRTKTYSATVEDRASTCAAAGSSV
jgi:hypothetical protein